MARASGAQKLLGRATTSRGWAQEARVGSFCELQDALWDCPVLLVPIGNQSGCGVEGRELKGDS